MKTKFRTCFALNIFQFTSEYIEEIRKLNPSNNFYSEIPKWIYRPNEKDEQKMIENYWFQFFSGKNERHIMFDVHYTDEYIKQEMSECGEEHFFTEIELHKLFKLIDINQNHNEVISLDINSKSQPEPYINSQAIFHKGFPIPTYIIVDIEYVTSYDYYSGGHDCEVDYELVGFLDNQFNLIKI